MKLNPKLTYFVENNIGGSKDTPYVLWEEGDDEKLQTLIEKFVLNEEERDFRIKRLEENHHLSQPPFYYFLNLISRLNYRKKDAGRKKVKDAIMQLFPNFDELHKGFDLGIYVSCADNSDWINSKFHELTELSKQTKEEDL